MPFSTSINNKLLDGVLGGVALSGIPATIYFGLSTTTPTVSGGNVTEPSGNGYARVAVANNTTNFAAASASVKANSTAIVWPTPTGSWGTLTHTVMYDAASGGTFLGFFTLNAAKTPTAGSTVSYAVGALTVTAGGT